LGGADDHCLQRLGSAAGSEPFRHVAVLVHTRKLQDPQGSSDACERARDLLCMSPSGLIMIGNHDDPRAREVGRKLPPPLARAAGIACRDEPAGAQAFDVFLTLDEYNPPIVLDAGYQLRQPVYDAAHAGQVPPPAASAIRSLL